ncbi:MAG: hypothetical protein AAGH15_22890 [Myxococcota bacterium]
MTRTQALVLTATLVACSGDDDGTDLDLDLGADLGGGDQGVDAGVDQGVDMGVGDPLTLTLLHMSDHASELLPDTLALDTSSLTLAAPADFDGGPITEVSLSYGGMPAFAAAFAARRAAATNPVAIHAGDAIPGTPYFDAFRGEADAAMMNAICFDAFALGDREFAEGDGALATFLDFLAADAGCETAVLAANVRPGSRSALATGYLEPSTVLMVEGQEVGVVGLLKASTRDTSAPDADTQFADEATTAQETIDALTDAGVTKIVLVTHQGYDADLALAASLRGVDVIVGGDSGTLLGTVGTEGLGLDADASYPTEVTDADGDPVCVVHAWERTRVFGELVVAFDGAGRVTSCTGRVNVPVPDDLEMSYAFDTGEGLTDRVLDATDRATVVTALEALPGVLSVTPDAEAAAALDDFTARLE